MLQIYFINDVLYGIRRPNLPTPAVFHKSIDWGKTWEFAFELPFASDNGQIILAQFASYWLAFHARNQSLDVWRSESGLSGWMFVSSNPIGSTGFNYRVLSTSTDGILLYPNLIQGESQATLLLSENLGSSWITLPKPWKIFWGFQVRISPFA